MDNFYSLKSNRKTVDIPATARLLKKLRLEYGYSVSDLQKLIGLESCVAIYSWESERIKNIPTIENFDFLARLYGLHVEDLYVLKTADISDMEVHENVPFYGIDFDLILKDLNEEEKEEFKKLMQLQSQEALSHEM